MHRHGIRCRSALGEAANADHNAVKTCKEKLPQLLMHMSVTPKNVFNLDEIALWLSVLPRKTHGNGRVARRKNAKERLTVVFLLFTHFIEQVHAAMFAEKRHIVILLDNGIIAMVKARYRAHWLKEFTAYWKELGGTTAMVRFRPNLRDVLAWLSDAWMNIGKRTIQRCWWRTRCLPLSWRLDLAHVGETGDKGEAEIEINEGIADVGILIDRLALGPSAMPTAEFVAVDNYAPTCAERGEDLLATEPESDTARSSWEAPLDTMAVCEDANPETRELRRTARAACEMLIGYARAKNITPRDLCTLFDIRNPVIVQRLERAIPRLNLNVSAAGSAPAWRGRVLPAWMTTPSHRQKLLDAGVTAVMDGYVASAEWVRM
ncbi:unnamed protein product [Closterium sp. Naga37s-1]|nr:unnamed protein product [Closterium sp. Naga37s-1]